MISISGNHHGMVFTIFSPFYASKDVFVPQEANLCLEGVCCVSGDKFVSRKIMLRLHTIVSHYILI